MIKGIIFDLDGTLLNTIEDLTNACNYTLKVLHEPLRTLTEVKAFVGNGIRNLLLRALYDQKKLTLHIKYLMIFYKLHNNDLSAPYEGIMDLLVQLKQLNIKLTIVSNKIDHAVKSLNQLTFMGYFDAANGDQEGFELKPNPELLNKTINDMGLKKEEVIYVGDSEVDFQTAHRANVSCCLVTWGFRSKEVLQALKPHYLISNPLEILDLIKR